MSESLPMPTRGPVEIETGGRMPDLDNDGLRECIAIVTESHMICAMNNNRIEFMAATNAALIAAAFNAAEEARKMGYDPIAAVQALPKLLVALRLPLYELELLQGVLPEFAATLAVLLAAARTRQAAP